MFAIGDIVRVTRTNRALNAGHIGKILRVDPDDDVPYMIESSPGHGHGLWCEKDAVELFDRGWPERICACLAKRPKVIAEGVEVETLVEKKNDYGPSPTPAGTRFRVTGTLGSKLTGAGLPVYHFHEVKAVRV